MKTFNHAATAAIFLLAFTAAHALDSLPPETDAELRTLRDQVTAAITSGNPDRLLPLLDEHGVITWQNGEVTRGGDELRTFVNRLRGGTNPTVKSHQAAVEVEGRIMLDDHTYYSYGKAHETFTLQGGHSLQWDSRWSALIRRGAEGWRVLALHASTDPFSSPLLAQARRSGWWVTAAAATLALLAGLLIGRLMRRG